MNMSIKELWAFKAVTFYSSFECIKVKKKVAMKYYKLAIMLQFIQIKLWHIQRK